MKKMFIILMMLFINIMIISCTDKTKTNISFEEYVNEINSYKLQGKLITYFPTGSKESSILVYYESPNKYRVELIAANTLDKQIILKNDDGVSILVPSINKTFKVSNDWPLTSSYPYLLQSLSRDIIADEKCIKEEKDGLIIYTVSAHIFDDAFETSQKIYISKDTSLPTKVEVYRDEETIITEFTFENIEIDIDIEDDIFMEDVTLKTIKDTIDSSNMEYDRVITYPVYCPTGLVMKEESIIGKDDSKRSIMIYAGNNNLIIHEEFVSSSEQTKTEYMTGTVYIFGANAYIVTDSTIKFYNSGIEYMLVSQNMDKLEMVYVADSLNYEDEK